MVKFTVEFWGIWLEFEVIFGDRPEEDYWQVVYEYDKPMIFALAQSELMEIDLAMKRAIGIRAEAVVRKLKSELQSLTDQALSLINVSMIEGDTCADAQSMCLKNILADFRSAINGISDEDIKKP